VKAQGYQWIDGVLSGTGLLLYCRRTAEGICSRAFIVVTFFSDALDLRGKPFERRVWETLRAIPFGKTASYGDIVKRIGAPKAARANGGLWRQ
jgi:hypothetical protein